MILRTYTVPRLRSLYNIVHVDKMSGTSTNSLETTILELTLDPPFGY